MAESRNHHSVFLSYSWDSDEHKTWVLRLAETLQREPDIEVTFDQFDNWPGSDLTHFMERGLECERVVVVSTPDYVQKSRGRTGGVGYECSLITAELVQDMTRDKFVPVLRHGDTLPSFLTTKLRVDFRDPLDFDVSMTKLLAAIRRQPEAVRPTKREGGIPLAPSARETRRPDSVDLPRLILEGRFDHRYASGRKQGLFLHNVGEGPAIEIMIDPIGHNPKWMRFGKVAVVRPGSEPVEVPVSYVQAENVFEVGGYLSMVSILRAGSSADGELPHGAHVIVIRYEDRHGTRHVDESYGLFFHQSETRIPADSYYEVARHHQTLDSLKRDTVRPIDRIDAEVLKRAFDLEED